MYIQSRRGEKGKTLIPFLLILFVHFITERYNESQVIEAERTHQQRESLVRHLYDSEEDYLRSLQDIYSCYKKPLLANLNAAESSRKTGILGSSSGVKAVASKEEIDALFGNLDQLIEFHEDIRSLLEGRSKIWGPTQIMSDLLLSVVSPPPLPYFSLFNFSCICLSSNRSCAPEF